MTHKSPWGITFCRGPCLGTALAHTVPPPHDAPKHLSTVCVAKEKYHSTHFPFLLKPFLKNKNYLIWKKKKGDRVLTLTQKSMEHVAGPDTIQRNKVTNQRRRLKYWRLDGTVTWVGPHVTCWRVTNTLAHTRTSWNWSVGGVIPCVGSRATRCGSMSATLMNVWTDPSNMQGGTHRNMGALGLRLRKD